MKINLKQNCLKKLNKRMDYKFTKIGRQFPKGELHLHLDGSLSLEFIFEQAKLRNIKLPINYENSKNGNLMKYLRDPLNRQAIIESMPNPPLQAESMIYFDFCNQFLQTQDELKNGTKCLVESLIEDNVRIIEIRFCPVLHQHEGLNLEQVVNAVIDGYCEGVKISQNKVIGGLIICSLRSLGVSHSLQMVELAYKFFNDYSREFGVIGWDIAGHEGLYPLKSHEQALILCKQLNIPITIHAGEWGLNDSFDTIDNLKLALEYADRIGHALTLTQDLELLKQFSQKQDLMIECCLTGNIKRMGNDYRKHPIRTFIENNIQVTLNSDNQFLNNTTSSDELEHFIYDLKFDTNMIQHAKNCVLNSCKSSFYWRRNQDNIQKSKFQQNLQIDFDKVIQQYLNDQSQII